MVLVACALLLASVLERARRSADGLDLESFVLGFTFAAVLVGVVGTLLATFGMFHAATISIGCTSAAAMLWPWGRPRPHARPVDVRALARRIALPLLLLAGSAALRWPPMDYALAGRDQGTYLLRAQQLARTGRFDDTDDVLARASAEVATRSGPADVLGLWPRRDDPAHEDVYEGPYRPGWYVADRERGVIVPQFLHLHPVLLATAMLAAGRAGALALPVVLSVLGVLALLAVARRLWPGPSAWPAIAAGVFAISPGAVWVGRSSLSEVPAMLVGWAAVLAILRARERRDRAASDELELAALLLGAMAWIRGNAWLAAPIVLAVVWLVPRELPRRGRAPAIYLALVVGAVLVHASTVFPYLHDELVRQLDLGRSATPIWLAGAAIVGALGWLAIDRVHAPALGDRLRAVVAPVLAGAAMLALAMYIRGTGDDGPPFSRLDPALPLFGAPLVAAAAIGVGLAVRGRGRPGAADTWLVALAATVPALLLLYAQRNLPQAGLYYYGRYLVPELLPVACLAATLAVATLAERVRSRLGAWPARLATLACVVALAWPASAFVTHPVTRLREFAGADRPIASLAEHVPADAIVVAGGEGWHHGHTYNQVGGALAMGHGRMVVPYVSREAAYATLHELAIAGPRARGEEPPAVFLLLNEATHGLAADARDGMAGERGVVAAFDDLVPAPFRARRVELLELLVHRLTPTPDAIPDRVTRDVLRMALVELTFDPAIAARIEHVAIGAVCLQPDRDTEIAVPTGRLAGAQSLVIVAAPGTAAHNDAWTVRIDGSERGTRVAGMPPRPRDTLGPFPVSSRPRTIALRGAAEPVDGAPCPFGGVLELRLLPLDRSALAEADTVGAWTFAPPQELGHPAVPLRWIVGRGLSRYRAGIVPLPQMKAVSMVLDPVTPIAFAPEPLPLAEELDLVVTLTGASVSADARLVVDADGIEIAEIDPPDAREGSWQSPPLRWRPSQPLSAFTLRLRGAAEGDTLFVRDIGLFARSEGVASRLAD